MPVCSHCKRLLDNVNLDIQLTVLKIKDKISEEYWLCNDCGGSIEEWLAANNDAVHAKA